MARTFTPLDGSVVMKALAQQATGRENIGEVNAANYVSIGETVLATGLENVFNSLGIVIGRTLVATRPKEASLKLIQSINTGMYTSRIRKISYYSKGPIASGFFNTDLYTNLANGFTNGRNLNESGNPRSTKSMWEQNQAMPVEVNFGGSTVWDYGITMYEEQARAALRDVAEMERFISGILTTHANDIEIGKEAFNRLALCTHIARTVSNAGNFSTMAVNLTAAFNARFGTSYTSAELRSTYLKEFLPFMIVSITRVAKYMKEISTAYHNPLTKTVNGENYYVLRHTQKDLQKLFLFEPLFEEARAYVLPEIFHNDELLLKENYEGVDFWQSNFSDDVRPSIDIDVPTRVNGVQTGSERVKLDYVVGMLFDRDALMVDYQLERALTTPLEARKGYRNTWLHISKNTISDDTENTVVFYMADED